MAEDSRVRRLPEELRTPPKPSEFTHIGNGAKRPKLTRQGSSSLLSKEDSARFVVTEKEFTQQFAHIYFTRLQLLRSHIRQQLVDNDEKTKVLEATNKLRKNTECILIGTFYKEMKLKPCILDEYTKQLDVEESVGKDYMSSSDTLVIEDQFGRVPLEILEGTGCKVQDFASGLVVGVRGKQREDGIFEVAKVIEPGIPPQIPLQEAKGRRGYVAFLSGLDIGREGFDPLPVQMMCDFLTGSLGSSQEQHLSSKIVRVVIAGNSLYPRMKTGDFTDRKVMDGSVVKRGLETLDFLLTQLCSTFPVTLMSGERDPVNYSLPQPPLLHSLFPSARTFTSFNTSTNPALLDVDGVRMLGSSGQPLSDLMSYSSASSLTAHLEKTLRWRNIAPTAPDTLACYPFKAGQNDPFIIDATPHVYFAANQDRFESRLLKAKSSKQEVTVCLLAVPSFSKTQTIALVDLDTLRAHPVNFSVRAAVTPEGQAQPPQPTPSQ